MKQIYIYLMLLIIVNFIYSTKIKVNNANEIISLINNRLSQIKTFEGKFIYEKGGKILYGTILYKTPDKFEMVFKEKDKNGNLVDTGQIIKSDGKVLWLIFKNRNIVITEYLKASTGKIYNMWNINRLTKEYTAVIPESGDKVKYGDSIAYKLEFIPKSNTSAFRRIYMIVSETGNILKVEAVNYMNEVIKLTYSYDSLNISLPDDRFVHYIDEETQVYENIILPAE